MRMKYLPRRSSTLTLRLKVVVLVVSLIVLLTSITSFLVWRRASIGLKEEVGVALASTAYQMTSRLDQYMWGRAGEIRMLSQLPALKEQQARAKVEPLLDSLQAIYPAFSWIGVTDAEGNVVAGTNGILVGRNIAQRPVYLEGRKGEFIGDVHEAVLLANLLPNPSGEQMKFVDISMPIIDDNGRFCGVVAAHLSWEWVAQIEQSMFRELQEKNRDDIFVISRQDNAVLLGPKSMLGHPLVLQTVQRAASEINGWSDEPWPDGRGYITGFALGTGYLDFAGLEWTVLVRRPVDVAYAGIYRLQTYVWLTGIVLSILFSCVGWYLAGSVAAPLRQLAKAADRFRFGGKMEIPAYKGTKEVEMLSESLFELVESLSAAAAEAGKMTQMAHHDRLTGLPNRIGLENFITKLEHESFATPEQGIAIIYLDLDGFKAVNDTLGHAAGDSVLQQVAERLQACVRAGDFVGRLGGDEFILVLPLDEASYPSVVAQLAKTIIARVNEPLVIGSQQARVGCSLGGAACFSSADVAVTMLLADEALYQAKKSGKNKIEYA